MYEAPTHLPLAFVLIAMSRNVLLSFFNFFFSPIFSTVKNWNRSPYRTDTNRKQSKLQGKNQKRKRKLFNAIVTPRRPREQRMHPREFPTWFTKFNSFSQDAWFFLEWKVKIDISAANTGKSDFPWNRAELFKVALMWMTSWDHFYFQFRTGHRWHASKHSRASLSASFIFAPITKTIRL